MTTLPFEINMNDYEYEVRGAPVVSTNRAPEPNNPLIRPEISFVKPVAVLITYIVLNIGLVIAYNLCSDFFEQEILLDKKSVVIFWVLLNIVFIALVAKRAIIWLVHVYQHYAPDEVRLKCVYEPSCSEYMILSVKKYGAIVGVIKGINRLFRCHPPNGGQDYP